MAFTSLDGRSIGGSGFWSARAGRSVQTPPRCPSRSGARIHHARHTPATRGKRHVAPMPTAMHAIALQRRAWPSSRHHPTPPPPLIQCNLPMIAQTQFTPIFENSYQKKCRDRPTGWYLVESEGEGLAPVPALAYLRVARCAQVSPRSRRESSNS
jgi:hypothetical protein